jgi:hypothetical protein
MILFYFLFYFIYVFDQKLSPKLKTTCLDWGKKQQLNLLYFHKCNSFTAKSMTLNFGRSFYTFQSKTDLILRQIRRWIWEKQLIKPKSRGFPMEIIPWNPLQHPLLSTTVTPSQQNRRRWIFGRSFYTFWTNTDLILMQIQRWIWEKQLIKPKSRGFPMEIIPWNPLQHPLLQQL